MLSRATRVFFTVTQISPECDLIGRFSVRGKAGLNRVRFTGRVGRKRLGPGAYRIGARTRGGSVVERVLLVVTDGRAPSRSELAVTRAPNACSDTGSTASAMPGVTGSSGLGFVGTTGKFARPLTTPNLLSVSPPSVQTPDAPLGGVLATSIEETAKALRPILIALLVGSILLFGLASMPQLAGVDGRANELLARHRLQIAALGTTALIAFTITFLVA